MMQLLFFATVYLTFSHLKDMVFLVQWWKNSMALNDMVRTIDLVFLPLICAFFVEATSPGKVANWHICVAVGVQAVFAVVFPFYPQGIVVHIAMVIAYAMAFATIVHVLIFSVRYHRFISSNYSYKENIDVLWVTFSCIVYFLSLFFYGFAFEETTWLSEALYNLFSLALWSLLMMFARRHRVISVVFAMEKPMPATSFDNIVQEETEALPAPSRDEEIATRLKIGVESGKLYLNPLVTLNDVAQAIGTNRTYLSDYFNNILDTSFYDYINTYRIAEACRIIDKMPDEGKKSMIEVAEMSGFNSRSTFHRYFMKVKGVSPKEYYNSIQNRPKAVVEKNSEEGGSCNPVE